MPECTFTTGIAAIRASALQKMKEGPVTGSYAVLRALPDFLGS